MLLNFSVIVCLLDVFLVKFSCQAYVWTKANMKREGTSKASRLGREDQAQVFRSVFQTVYTYNAMINTCYVWLCYVWWWQLSYSVITVHYISYITRIQFRHQFSVSSDNLFSRNRIFQSQYRQWFFARHYITITTIILLLILLLCLKIKARLFNKIS